MSNTLSELNALFKAAYSQKLGNLVSNLVNIHDWSVQDWIKYGQGIPDWEKYPNAVAAKKIMDSKLYKVMK